MLLAIAGVVVVLVAAMLVALRVPCQQVVTSQKVFRGCTIRVYGLIGRCRSHGRHPVVRLIGVLGGTRLVNRRICPDCGQRIVFARQLETGSANLECARAKCSHNRPLKSYVF